MGFVYDPCRGGVFDSEMGVVPGPGTIFRRQAVLDIFRKGGGMKHIQNGKKYLGIGCGIAAVDYEFYRKGFSCTVTDWSEAALENVNRVYHKRQKVFRVKRMLENMDVNAYDVLGAFEVLEHAKDDRRALGEWAKYLKKDGMLVLSVPAHQKLWSCADAASGHYRRYEKDQLRKVMRSCGFTDIHIISTGFPFMNLLLPLARSIRLRPLMKKHRKGSKESKTLSTGLIAPQLYRLRHWIPFRLLVCAAKVQRLFYESDLGYDYVAIGWKR